MGESFLSLNPSRHRHGWPSYRRLRASCLLQSRHQSDFNPVLFVVFVVYQAVRSDFKGVFFRRQSLAFSCCDLAWQIVRAVVVFGGATLVSFWLLLRLIGCWRGCADQVIFHLYWVSQFAWVPFTGGLRGLLFLGFKIWDPGGNFVCSSWSLSSHWRQGETISCFCCGGVLQRWKLWFI